MSWHISLQDDALAANGSEIRVTCLRVQNYPPVLLAPVVLSSDGGPLTGVHMMTFSLLLCVSVGPLSKP